MVIYDPRDRVAGLSRRSIGARKGLGRRHYRSMGNMDDRDIYTLARKLAELLLEQL